MTIKLIQHVIPENRDGKTGIFMLKPMSVGNNILSWFNFKLISNYTTIF